MDESTTENNLISYKVSQAETISSVAAKHGTTPQKIARLNRITSSYVFPGQIIIIPQTIPEVAETVSPKKPIEIKDPIIFETSARHLTTNLGCAAGNIIVTLRNLYFDALLDDPGARDHGIEIFRIEQPISNLVSLSTFSQITEIHICSDEPMRDVLYFRMRFVPTQNSKANEFWLEIPIDRAFEFQKFLLLSSSSSASLPPGVHDEGSFKKVGHPEPPSEDYCSSDYFYKSVIECSKFDKTTIDQIFQHVPARVCCEDWQMIYSTENDGYSLLRLIRAYKTLENSSLLIIKDFNKKVFGAYLSHPLRLGKSFYGTGETYLFSFYPKWSVYRWTGDNNYFIKCNIDGLIFGASEGHYGLWIDEELSKGTSGSCATFHNQCLTLDPDFVINSIEVWSYSQGWT